jgi:hypothetical protein
MTNIKINLILFAFIGPLTVWGQQNEYQLPSQEIDYSIDFQLEEPFSGTNEAVMILGEEEIAKPVVATPTAKEAFNLEEWKAKELTIISLPKSTMPTVIPPEYKNIPFWNRDASEQHTLIIAPK